MKRNIILFIGIFCVTCLFAQSFDYEKITPHPRLLWPVEREEAIKKSMAVYPPLINIHKRIF